MTHLQQWYRVAFTWRGRSERDARVVQLIDDYRAYWRIADEDVHGPTSWCLLWAIWVIRLVRPEIFWPRRRDGPDHVLPWHGSVSGYDVNLLDDLEHHYPDQLHPIEQAQPGDLLLSRHHGHAGFLLATEADGQLLTLEANVAGAGSRSDRVDVMLRRPRWWSVAWRWRG